MIEIKNLTKNYPSVSLYNGFGLTVWDGEVTCILGESGSGKTTLLNAVANLCEYSGEITPVRCAYVFQSPRLVPCLTVYENLKLVCKERDKIAEMLGMIGLSEKSASYPRELSGGQAQRVALARAFLYGGDAMLLDEPFSSLDMKLKYAMIDLFFKLWDKRQPVLCVTHDIDEALKMAHRIIILSGGSIVADLSLGEADVSGERLREKIVSLMLTL